MSIMQKLFVTHPESVGETWFEHLCHASWFAGMMIYGGIACLIHALVPGACEKTGSRVISLLHDRMVVNRVKSRKPAEPVDVDTSARPALF